MNSTFCKLITRRESEQFDDAMLESRFADLKSLLANVHRNEGERLLALASLETLEAERIRRMARRPRLAM